jgi:hypothetical protein
MALMVPGPRVCRVAGRLAAGVLLCAAAGCSDADRTRWDDFWKNPQGGGLFAGAGGGGRETWTIECNEYRGPQRREMADRMMAALKRVQELSRRPVWVIHDANRSRVLCGEYRLRYVQAKSESGAGRGDMVIELSEELKRDLEFIRRLAIGDRYPFFSARPIQRPTAHVGPPEWDLRHAKGTYTLNVGVTFRTQGLENYKEAAVEWVRDLRSRGYEAYYYHDPDLEKTSVCIGTFGEDALTRDANGKEVYSEAVRQLRQKEEEFLYNLENGHRIYRMAPNPDTGKVERMPNWSFLARIPRPEPESPGDTR